MSYFYRRESLINADEVQAVRPSSVAERTEMTDWIGRRSPAKKGRFCSRYADFQNHKPLF